MTVEDDLAALAERVSMLESQVAAIEAPVTFYQDPAEETERYYEAEEKALKARDDARKFGSLVKEVRAVRDDRKLAHLPESIEPDPDEVIRIVGGTITAKEIPLVDGRPTGAWLMTYCLCEAHVKMRRDRTLQ